ncbi:MAG: DUF1275 domain-containing protein [Hyphomicrobiales bacterium]|nr:MAG: DUF1275 domain-containing protein [Hyphomicrobiales bacterium]
MTPARTLSLGLLLTGLAGFVDAVGFIVLGGYYTSFMSGNTTQLGAGAASGMGWALALPAALIVLFFIGSFMGTLIAQSSSRWGQAATLGLVVLTIGLSLLLHFSGYPAAQAMLPLALAAGTQNAVLQPIGAARLGTTFVTGTLFAAGQDLARATAGKAPPWRWLQHVMVWAALCAGALLGALAFGWWSTDALLVPGIAYLACMLWFVVVRPR